MAGGSIAAASGPAAPLPDVEDALLLLGLRLRS